MAVVNVKRRADVGARHRRRVVAVIGSGLTAGPECAELGRLIAALGVDLLTGGGRGVMEAVSRAFHETSPRSGVVIGVIPARVHGLDDIEQRTATDVAYEPPPGYPNPWVEIAIYTHLPDSGREGALRSSRNHINVLSADAIVALPGREGTESEVWLAKQYGVPVVAFGNHAGGAPHGIAHLQSLAEVRDFLVTNL
jgi:predicted Rossmann-fold nucleotide-binding protein